MKQILERLSRLSLACAAVVTAFALAACEKAIIDEDHTRTTADPRANVVLRVSGSQVDAYEETRAVVDLTTYCTRLCFVVYKDGKRIDSRTQMQGDADYGQVSMTLDAGTYKLLVLAHRSAGGNPTLTDPENIRFSNAVGFSDTFYYYGDLEVEAKAKTHDIVLTRACSLLRITINDETLPDNLAKISVYYTGGSGVLNALTGYGGSVDSRQEALFNIANRNTPKTIPIYTFLQEDTGKLNVTVTALDDDGNTIEQRTFAGVNMQRNRATDYVGTFFSHSSENTFNLVGETDWLVLETVEY